MPTKNHEKRSGDPVINHIVDVGRALGVEIRQLYVNLDGKPGERIAIDAEYSYRHDWSASPTLDPASRRIGRALERLQDAAGYTIKASMVETWAPENGIKDGKGLLTQGILPYRVGVLHWDKQGIAGALQEFVDWAAAQISAAKCITIINIKRI